jgi:hypothetical protein
MFYIKEQILWLGDYHWWINNGHVGYPWLGRILIMLPDLIGILIIALTLHVILINI